MPLLKYSRCSTDELKAFAHARNIQVSPPHAFRHRRSSRADYINALKQADKDFTFRFMDLAPELRNRICRELLLFHNSYFCQPRILATCKTIHSEASAILYRDNLIEVKLRRDFNSGIYQDSVRVHGVPCSPLEQFDAGSAYLTDYHWPEFLCRAQWIRFSTRFESMLGNARDLVRSPIAQLNRQNLTYVFYSLCSFLQNKHCLVAIEIDAGMQLADILAKPARGLEEEEEAAHQLLSPLQLLAPLSVFEIINRDRSVAQLTQSSFPGRDRLQGGVLGPHLQMMQEVESCERLARHYDSCGDIDSLYYPPAARELVWLTRGIAMERVKLKPMPMRKEHFERSIERVNIHLKSRLDGLDLDALWKALPADVLGSRMEASKILDELRAYRDSRVEMEEAGDRSAA
ncbi:hypothetical protein LTR12_009594 [Friedmanniomyces endolithicus]|nr:hypothetical protein LTR12_009594 [Friedmanniomyces endolithicus]